MLLHPLLGGFVLTTLAVALSLVGRLGIRPECGHLSIDNQRVRAVKGELASVAVSSLSEVLDGFWWLAHPVE